MKNRSAYPINNRFPYSLYKMDVNLKRKNRWYDGGLAASGACCFTHPLDLLKVHLQTSGGTGKLGIVGQTVHIIRSQGGLAMFNGLSASVLRNLTYSTTRFAIYGNYQIPSTHFGLVFFKF